MVEPLSGPTFNAQGIGEHPGSKPKGQQNTVENCQEEARLKVSDLVRQLLPSLPRSFQYLHRLPFPGGFFRFKPPWLRNYQRLEIGSALESFRSCAPAPSKLATLVSVSS